MKPSWERLGHDWPNHEASRFLFAGGVRWHVQIMGSGPPLLLLHGMGAATHSWRDVAPLLARDFTLIAPDLPGHGFSDTPRGDGLSLPGMARALAALLAKLDLRPRFAVGHSAGAAIALRMMLDHRLGDGGLVSLNGALASFQGPSARIFPAMAKMLMLNPLTDRALALRAGRPGVVAKLIADTGSQLDAAGLRHYTQLLRTSGHIAGALGMMARWDLQALETDMAGLAAPLTLVAAAGDTAVPPSVAESVHARLPQSRLIVLPKLGHLAHEEAPAKAAAIIQEAFGAGLSSPEHPRHPEREHGADHR
ncbi:MAG: alpha/beta fold hydrolase BchO [Caulobacteraceae bacterium]